MLYPPICNSRSDFASIEPLEGRRLLSASIVGSTLLVEGTGGVDTIEITLDSADLIVRINSDTRAFASGEVNRIEIHAGGGDDAARMISDVTQDALILGEAGNDTLMGGSGSDTLVGGAGSDLLNGGAEAQDDAANNLADFSDRTADLSMAENQVTGGGDTDTLVGNIQRLAFGSGNDSLFINGSGPGSIRSVDGGPGDDSIEMLSFEDVTAHGGPGNDRILILVPGFTGHYFGDGGNDVFTVQRSSATNRDFNGGAGADTVDYRGFINEFWPVTISLDDVANDGSPTEWESQSGRDNAHSDVERIIGTPGPDTIRGGDGNEILYGMAGNDTIRGGAGNDRIYGGDGNDWINGDDGNDVIYGQAGNDRLFGGAGIDFLAGGPGMDLIRGGIGVDRIILNSRRGDFRGNTGDLFTLIVS